jgi:hypothetical protein
MGIYGASRYEADRIAIDFIQDFIHCLLGGGEGDKVGRWGRRGGLPGDFPLHMAIGGVPPHSSSSNSSSI